MAKVLIVCTLLLLVLGIECATRTYYTAAVVEHAPIYSSQYSVAHNLHSNIVAYLQHIKKASAQGADIIVFPEYGLTFVLGTIRSNIRFWATEIPDPKVTKNFVPCKDMKYSVKNEAFVSLSCAAQNFNMTVVANYLSMVDCSDKPDCPSDGAFIYNTDVVFDNKGVLITRYHKKHLFGEPFFNSPKKFDVETFQTTFGKFGLFICYDIAFKESVELVRKHQIDSVVYSTHWVEILPSFTAIQVQSGFARGQRVNVLAANFHDPLHSAVGSGIYSGKHGAVNYTLSTGISFKMLISKVPINPKKDDYVPEGFTNNEILIPQRYRPAITLPITQFKLVRIKNASGILETSQKDVTCRLEYEIESKNFSSAELSYVFGARDGVFLSLPQKPLAFKGCLLLNFGHTKDAKQYVFKRIKLTLKIKGQVLQAVYPSVVTNYMKLAPSHEWSYSNQTINAPKGISRPLRSISLLARDFAHDG